MTQYKRATLYAFNLEHEVYLSKNYNQDIFITLIELEGDNIQISQIVLKISVS